MPSIVQRVHLTRCHRLDSWPIHLLSVLRCQSVILFSDSRVTPLPGLLMGMRAAGRMWFMLCETIPMSFATFAYYFVCLLIFSILFTLYYVLPFPGPSFGGLDFRFPDDGEFPKHRPRTTNSSLHYSSTLLRLHRLAAPFTSPSRSKV